MLRKLEWDAATPTPQTAFFAAWWVEARKRIHKEGRKCFDSLVVLVRWLIIWKECNVRTFDRRVSRIEALLCRVADELVA